MQTQAERQGPGGKVSWRGTHAEGGTQRSGAGVRGLRASQHRRRLLERTYEQKIRTENAGVRGKTRPEMTWQTRKRCRRQSIPYQALYPIVDWPSLLGVSSLSPAPRPPTAFLMERHAVPRRAMRCIGALGMLPCRRHSNGPVRSLSLSRARRRSGPVCRVASPRNIEGEVILAPTVSSTQGVQRRQLSEFTFRRWEVRGMN